MSLLTDPLAPTPDDLAADEVCMETADVCGASHHNGHKCGELANHEAGNEPHRCHLPDEEAEGVSPAELPVCNYEWETGEDANV